MGEKILYDSWGFNLEGELILELNGKIVFSDNCLCLHFSDFKEYVESLPISFIKDDEE